MTKKRVLTGITTTGTPHLGNYVGAIAPAIAASLNPHNEGFYFLADYHALVKCDDAARVKQSRLELAATWLACGLNPDKVYFYRQSDIPEITELTWILSCVAAKGLFNRAHAYKAAVDANAGNDPDAAITMGLYCYPALMAADILMFNANLVPVGKDQIQHIEMTRDIAARFNHLYQTNLFTLPEAIITEDNATLPGIDGRKMSKSYNNTLPLFAEPKHLQQLVNKIVTDSADITESKNPTTSNLYQIYAAIADQNSSAELADDLQNGLSWSEAKKRLFTLLDSNFADKREQYNNFLSRPSDLEDILQTGAQKARQTSSTFMMQIRDAVGLSNFTTNINYAKKNKSTNKKARWLSFHENDAFFFKLLDEKGKQILISKPFDDGKSAGNALKNIKDGNYRLQELSIYLDNQKVAEISDVQKFMLILQNE